MKIVYEDGSILTCNKIVLAGNKVYADDIYEVLVADVKEIQGE